MYTLLDRKTFYPDLIEEIARAQKQVLVDAYIWIDDTIGNKIARALLEAANRGIKVFIRKDLSASVFEHTPNRAPFFVSNNELEKGWKKVWSKRHGLMTPKTFNTCAFYIYGKQARPVIEENPLLQSLSRHDNIFIENDPFFNHGKLILVDDTAYVGGQCISNDYTEWIDYNVKVKNPKVTQNIYAQVQGFAPPHSDLESQFVHNLFTEKEPIHYFLKRFIDEVPEGEPLIVEMSYFGKWFVPILKNALARKVPVTVLASKESDTNHHTNMWVLTQLLETQSPYLTVALSDTMIHTKGLATPTKATIGAANFHNACGYFKALNEQNIVSTHPPLVEEVWRRFTEDVRSATVIKTPAELPQWKRRSALVEILSVYFSGIFIFLNKRRIQGWRDRANARMVTHNIHD